MKVVVVVIEVVVAVIVVVVVVEVIIITLVCGLSGGKNRCSDIDVEAVGYK